MSSTEFVEWMWYLDEEVNDFHREDYYMAQIAAEIARMFSSAPERITNESRLLRFTKDSAPEQKSEANYELDSLNFWSAVAGVSLT